MKATAWRIADSSGGAGSVSSTGVSRHPTWLATSGGDIAAWLHAPVGEAARASGVVICPPFGYEYTHSHRSLIHLADAFARAGIAAVRFDYLGTGDSQGDGFEPNLCEGWLESIAVAAEYAGRVTAGTPSLLGLRFGGFLAGLAASRFDVEHLILWHPVVSGRRYLREYEALQRIATAAVASSGVIEAGGFVMSAETAATVRSLDLTAVPYRVRGRALILERDDLKADGRLAAHVEAAGVPNDRVMVSGYLGMMAEPQYTEVPERAIQSIVAWTSEAMHPETIAIQRERIEHRALSSVWTRGPIRFHEELITIPARSQDGLFGVLTVPEAGDSSGSALVLSNSGTVHHVGPNRLYVEVARSSAAAGLATLRFDLANLGDSCRSGRSDENHPYPVGAVEDLQSAIEWLSSDRGFETCIAAGLCSGAHTSFRAGLKLSDSRLRAVLCINPLTFDWRPGMSLDTPATYQTTRDAQYYGTAMRDRAKWAKLLRGEADIAYIARFVLRRVLDRAAYSARSMADSLGVSRPTRLQEELATYAASDRPLSFVFSMQDPGHAILLREGRSSVKKLLRSGVMRIRRVQDADHTFSRLAWREEAVRAIQAEVTFLGSRGVSVRREVIPYGSTLWTSLRPVWTALSEQTNDPSPFLSATWIERWLSAFGSRVRPSGLVWRSEQGVPVGCALLSRGAAHIGPFPVTRTYLNASGVPGAGCEHNDILVLARFRTAVIRDLVAVLLERPSDELALEGFRDSAFEELLRMWPVPHWEGIRSESPYVDLSELRQSDESYLSRVSPNTRSQVKRSIRLYAEQFGDPCVQAAESPEDVEPWFNEMISLHEQRWLREARRGAFVDEEVRRFHHDLIDHSSTASHERHSSFAADLLRVQFGAETIGFLYHLRSHGRVNFLQSGFRQHEDNRLKPGLVSHVMAIEYYLQGGAIEYDFLGGEAHPVRYKRSLATHQRTLVWAQLPKPGPKMRAVRGLRLARRNAQASWRHK